MNGARAIFWCRKIPKKLEMGRFESLDFLKAILTNLRSWESTNFKEMNARCEDF